MADLLGVRPGGVSRNLQRLVVDFGAESSFAQASARLELHHRVALCATTVRKITLTHAAAIAELETPGGGVSLLPAKGAACIVSGIDGTMLPIVQTEATQPGGGRKNRHCHWKETRLAAARVHGELTTHYAVSAGSVEEAGHSWAKAVAQAGWGLDTELHAVCDGAAWIAFQCQSALGRDAHFLLDFYHVCEYLAAAAPSVARNSRSSWLSVQKKRLKTNRVDRVIKELTPWLEAAHLPDEQAPVRAAKRYLQNHIHQLDYKGALEKGLPIGSGMIEASHRHVLQKRLKISGAWWTQANALSMAHLRVCRANHLDHLYWVTLPLAA